MNETAGIFTTSVNGTYFFSFTGTVNFVSTSVSWKTYNVQLILNDVDVGYAQIDESNTADSHNDSLHLEAMLVLTRGD